MCGMPVNGQEHLSDSIQCTGRKHAPEHGFGENHQISVSSRLDNGLFGGKEFVNIARDMLNSAAISATVGFGHDPVTCFIAGQTFASKRPMVIEALCRSPHFADSSLGNAATINAQYEHAITYCNHKR